MGLINIDPIETTDSATPVLWNDRYGTIVDEINGNLDADNLADNAVPTSKIVDEAVTADKIEEQQAWQNVVYSNSWVDYDADTLFGVQYYKDSLGIVHLRGVAKSGTTTTGTVMFTLPAGYRPGRQEVHVVNSNNAFARVDLKTNGTCTTNTGVNAAFVSFSGISFRAEG